MDRKKLIVVCGPTAIGKSRLSLDLAKHYGIPIISADSRQIYRELTIGTAKPNKDQLSQIKHHFIDHISIKDEYSVGRYEKESSLLIQELFKHSNYVLVVGGTGLYIRSIINGLDEFPDITKEAISFVSKQYQEKGVEALQKLLQEKDPLYYSKVDLPNPRRLIRALEVYYSSGKSYSSFLKYGKRNNPFEVKEIFLNVSRVDLYNTINLRVDQMIKEGLIDECMALMEFKELQALQTVGYKEIFEFLAGNCDLQPAIEKIKQHTRNYAKRQLIWFSKYSSGLQTDPKNTKEILQFIDV